MLFEGRIETTIFQGSFVFLKPIGLDTCTACRRMCMAEEAVQVCQGLPKPAAYSTNGAVAPLLKQTVRWLVIYDVF
jgi:hypothetical protein